MAMMTLRVEPSPGCTISRAAEDAIRLAGLLDVGVSFNFNGVMLVAFAHSVADDLVAKYERKIMEESEFPRSFDTTPLAIEVWKERLEADRYFARGQRARRRNRRLRQVAKQMEQNLGLGNCINLREGF